MELPYSEAFRAQMVRRMIGPPGISATSLATQVGVSQASLSRWLRGAGSVPSVSERSEEKPQAPQPKKWTTDEKLRVVAEAKRVKPEHLGELLRREGLHEDQLRRWTDAAAGALESAEAAPSAGLSAAERRKQKATDKRVRELEKELRRKDKALAEAAAMLMLEKKLQAMGWDDEDGGTNERNDK